MCWADVSGDNNITFETQAVYNNFDDRHYLGGFSRGWSSNLPANDYKEQDIRKAGFPEDYRTYTVGTSRADRLQVGKSYWVYRKQTKGNSKSDLAKVSGQAGYRRPIGCDSKWCIYGRTTRNMLPWDSHVVPGTTRW